MKAAITRSGGYGGADHRGRTANSVPWTSTEISSASSVLRLKRGGSKGLDIGREAARRLKAWSGWAGRKGQSLVQAPCQ